MATAPPQPWRDSVASISCLNTLSSTIKHFSFNKSTTTIQVHSNTNQHPPANANMHLHSVHRSNYYSAPAARYSTLARRDSGGGDSLWQMIVAPIAIVVGIILLLYVIARFVKKRYAKKKNQSSGQLSHLQLGSLRRKKQADSSDIQGEFSESSFGKEHSDVELGMPTPTHAREWNRPGYSESSSTYRATPYNGFPGGWPAMHGQVPSAYPSPASDGWESVTSHSSKSYR